MDNLFTSLLRAAKASTMGGGNADALRLATRKQYEALGEYGIPMPSVGEGDLPEGFYGRFNPLGSPNITLGEGYSADVIPHELLHAIYWLSGVDATEKLDSVARIEAGLPEGHPRHVDGADLIGRAFGSNPDEYQAYFLSKAFQNKLLGSSDTTHGAFFDAFLRKLAEDYK